MSLRLSQHEPRFNAVRIGLRQVCKDFVRACRLVAVLRVVPSHQLTRERSEARAIASRRPDQAWGVNGGDKRPAPRRRQAEVGEREGTIGAQRGAKRIARGLGVARPELSLSVEKSG